MKNIMKEMEVSLELYMVKILFGIIVNTDLLCFIARFGKNAFGKTE